MAAHQVVKAGEKYEISNQQLARTHVSPMSTILSNGNFDFGNGYFDKDDFGEKWSSPTWGRWWAGSCRALGRSDFRSRTATYQGAGFPENHFDQSFPSNNFDQQFWSIMFINNFHQQFSSIIFINNCHQLFPSPHLVSDQLTVWKGERLKAWTVSSQLMIFCVQFISKEWSWSSWWSI